MKIVVSVSKFFSCNQSQKFKPMEIKQLIAVKNYVFRKNIFANILQMTR